MKYLQLLLLSLVIYIGLHYPLFSQATTATRTIKLLTNLNLDCYSDTLYLRYDVFNRTFLPHSIHWGFRTQKLIQGSDTTIVQVPCTSGSITYYPSTTPTLFINPQWEQLQCIYTFVPMTQNNSKKDLVLLYSGVTSASTSIVHVTSNIVIFSTLGLDTIPTIHIPNITNYTSTSENWYMNLNEENHIPIQEKISFFNTKYAIFSPVALEEYTRPSFARQENKVFSDYTSSVVSLSNVLDKLPLSECDYKIIIYSIQGKMMYQAKKTKNDILELPTELSFLTNGVYLIHVECDSSVLFSSAFMWIR